MSLTEQRSFREGRVPVDRARRTLVPVLALLLGGGLLLSPGSGVPSVSAADTFALNLASTVWPPFTNVDGEAHFAIDLVDEALERAGILQRTTIVDDGALTPALEKETFDGSAALWRAPERARYLLYSEPYLENRLILVGRKGADVSATELSDLQGKTVALVQGYAYGEEVAGEGPGPVFEYGRSEAENLEKLLEGEVDYLLVDALVIRYMMEDYAEESQEHLEIGDTPLLQRSLHFAVRRSLPDAPTIIDRFNREIRKMLADGTYNRILDLNTIRADVDGDGVQELVLRGERAGAEPPEDGYEVISLEKTAEAPAEGSRFVIGGEVYPDWERVPAKYKNPDPTVNRPSTSRVDFLRLEF